MKSLPRMLPGTFSAGPRRDPRGQVWSLQPLAAFLLILSRLPVNGPSGPSGPAFSGWSP